MITVMLLGMLLLVCVLFGTIQFYQETATPLTVGLEEKLLFVRYLKSGGVYNPLDPDYWHNHFQRCSLSQLSCTRKNNATLTYMNYLFNNVRCVPPKTYDYLRRVYEIQVVAGNTQDIGQWLNMARTYQTNLDPDHAMAWLEVVFMIISKKSENTEPISSEGNLPTIINSSAAPIVPQERNDIIADYVNGDTEKFFRTLMAKSPTVCMTWDQFNNFLIREEKRLMEAILLSRQQLVGTSRSLENGASSGCSTTNQSDKNTSMDCSASASSQQNPR